MQRRQRKSALAVSRRSGRGEQSGVNPGRSRRTQRFIHALGSLEYRSNDSTNRGREFSCRCCAGRKRFRQDRIRRAVSTVGEASLFLSPLRARSKTKSEKRGEPEGPGQSNGRPHPRPRRVDGTLHSLGDGRLRSTTRSGAGGRPRVLLCFATRLWRPSSAANLSSACSTVLF